MSSILKVDTIQDASGNAIISSDGSGNLTPNTFTALTVSGDLTVDTNTLYVDSSNNRVGVKNASPTVELDVTGEAKISGDLTVDTDTLYVDSTNNLVGIGTSSPSYKLDVTGSIGIKTNDAFYRGTSVAGSSVRLVGLGADDNVYVGSVDSLAGSNTIFRTNGTERMRIDSSGNVLVGTTSFPSGSTTGLGFQGSSNYIYLARSGGELLNLDRHTSDGDIAIFRRGGTTVGSINTNTTFGTFQIHGNATSGWYFGTNFMLPIGNTDSILDNAVDLGNAGVRFDDIYATNGTIQTSDRNEKRQIASLTDAEINVAKRISQGFKTFKWNSAVEKKGDNARTHTGVIAQEVQQAFADEGLDAGNYGMFMSNTWWEKEISVDAVEAQDAVYETQTDDEGNETQVLVQEAIEGKDAYTYMDTKEEPTEGYTEKTRLGIRYPELLSFVSSAFEQRLTDIETRLTALET